MLSIILLLNQLQHPFSATSSIIPVIFSRHASAERLSEITSKLKCLPDEELPTIPYDKFSSIEFLDVTFDYGREQVLKTINMHIRKNQTICIVGTSGLGKSTLFKLLLGVYQPTNGIIKLHTFEGESLLYSKVNHDLFAYVPQGNFLFSGTIRENLLYFANEQLDDEIIRKAITVAQAEFIYELPNGIDTLLSERGTGLSEGQQQRLAIARALLSSKPILLLDESTSALDGLTEEKLLKAIKELTNKTCIFVTHRPSTLSIADEIYEIVDGRISVRTDK